MILKFWGHRAHPYSMTRYCARIFLWKGAILTAVLIAGSLTSSVIGHARPIPWGCLSWSLLADTSGTRRLWPWCFDLVGQNKNVSRDYRVFSILAFVALVYFSFFHFNTDIFLSHAGIAPPQLLSPFSHFVRNCGVLLWFLPSCFRRSCLPWAVEW